MDDTEAWYWWAFSDFGHPFGSSNHPYYCMSSPSSKSVVFQFVVIFNHGDPCTGYIQRSRALIDDSTMVPSTYSSFYPDSSLNSQRAKYSSSTCLQVDYYYWVVLFNIYYYYIALFIADAITTQLNRLYTSDHHHFYMCWASTEAYHGYSTHGSWHLYWLSWLYTRSPWHW